MVSLETVVTPVGVSFSLLKCYMCVYWGSRYSGSLIGHLGPRWFLVYLMSLWQCHSFKGFALPATLLFQPLLYKNVSFSNLFQLIYWCCFLITQLCPILCNLKDCSLPDSPDHWISQARTVEWVAISFCKESSQSRDQVCIFCIAGRCFINSSAVKHLPAMQEETMNNEGDVGLIPGSGRSPGERNGTPLQYSCLGNPMDRVWWAVVHGVARVRQDLAAKPPPIHC